MDRGHRRVRSQDRSVVNRTAHQNWPSDQLLIDIRYWLDCMCWRGDEVADRQRMELVRRIDNALRQKRGQE